MTEQSTVADPVDDGDPSGSRSAAAEGVAPADGGVRTPRKLTKRKQVKRATVVTHRWVSFTLLLLLLVITTSGAAVVYSPEWTRWSNSSVFEVTKTDNPISIPQAIDTVRAAHPEFELGYVNLYSGLYEVYASEESPVQGFYGVDPGTGRITGHANPSSGFMAFMNQVHECFLSCDDYPGYVSSLDDEVPSLGMHWLSETTWASLLLGGSAVVLLFLGVSGVALWWPGIKRMSHGFRVRTGKGRYARDYDLHQVIGMAAVPFLFIWGLTGASFEFHWVNTAWYAVTGGEQDIEAIPFASNAVANKSAADIGLPAAIAAGRSKADGNAVLVYVALPAADDATATYDLWFSQKWDQYRHGASPGQLEVLVDRHDTSRTAVNDYGTAKTLSNKVLDQLGAPTFHYGQSFNGWWRIFWFAFGLTPLALAATGISTWLAKRSVRRRRLAAKRSFAAGPES